MDYRKTYAWLMRERWIERRIRRLSIRRAELLSCLTSASAGYDQPRVQHSRRDKMAAVMAEVDALDREIEELLLKKADVVVEIGAAIELLEDENEKDVLTRFFVERKPMKDIAVEISYSLSRTYAFRDNGVRNLGKELQEKKEKEMC